MIPLKNALSRKMHFPAERSPNCRKLQEGLVAQESKTLPNFHKIWDDTGMTLSAALVVGYLVFNVIMPKHHDNLPEFFWFCCQCTGRSPELSGFWGKMRLYASRRSALANRCQHHFNAHEMTAEPPTPQKCSGGAGQKLGARGNAWKIVGKFGKITDPKIGGICGRQR